MRLRRPILRLLGVLAFAAAIPSSVTGQGAWGELRAGGSFLELRPLVRDSLPDAQVAGDGIRRRLPDGTVVTCTPSEFCRWYRSGEPESFAVVTQELIATAWPGVTGLSAHLHLRSRYGSDDVWPLSSQKFEVVSAYVSYDGARIRGRAGRLFRTDGLGYYNFDGASLLWRGPAAIWVELYGGWGLARGLNAPRTGALLEEADDLAPDDRGLILGAEVGARLGGIASGRLMYQREIRTDRLALYSERVTLDGRARIGPATVDLASEYDFAQAELNEARLRLTAPLPARLELSAEARHYRPFFELWTIWGAFSPVGFQEGRLAFAWSAPTIGLRLEAGGAYRDYEDTNAGATFVPIRKDGWRGFVGGSWASRDWYAAGNYRAEAGFGAARFGGDLSLGRNFGSGAYLSIRGSLTQTFGEFRLNEQLVAGGGVDGAVRLGPVSLTAGAALYHLGMRERVQDGDWTQGRVYVGIATRFGAEPVARNTPRARSPSTNPGPEPTPGDR